MDLENRKIKNRYGEVKSEENKPREHKHHYDSEALILVCSYFWQSTATTSLIGHGIFFHPVGSEKKTP